MKRFCILLAALFLVSPILFSANINVPSFEIYTRGTIQGASFGLESTGEMDLLVEGGYKFGARIVLDFSSVNIFSDDEDAEDPEDDKDDYLVVTGLDNSIPVLLKNSVLGFKAASVVLRSIFGLPLDISYFIGESDTFGSGDIFVRFFASDPIATEYSGYIHFPDTIPYDGIHTLSGTGFKIDLAPNPEALLLSLFIYQDANIDADNDPTTFDTGYYSADFRTALNFQALKVEAFIGGTLPAPGAYGYLRGGLLFYAADKGVEFLTQIGIPRWSPLADTFGIDLFYLLFEPRIHIGIFSIIPTFFWRPSYYHQEDTGEQAFDINLNLQLGRPTQTLISGGIETNFVYKTESEGETVGELGVKLSPYLRFLTSGVLWEVRVNTKLWPLPTPDLTDFIECFLAIRAEF